MNRLTKLGSLLAVVAGVTAFSATTPALARDCDNWNRSFVRQQVMVNPYVNTYASANPYAYESYGANPNFNSYANPYYGVSSFQARHPMISNLLYNIGL